MSEQYADLFARIHEHCRAQGWYGPDAEAPGRFRGSYEFSYNLCTGRDYADDHAHDPRAFGFTYAPATEAQLRATEQRLGMPLPPALLALYATVANGGFGPGYGIVGVVGGFPSIGLAPDTDEFSRVEFSFTVSGYPCLDGPSLRGPLEPRQPGFSDRTLAATVTRNTWRLPESAALALERRPEGYLELDPEDSPDNWVTLCHWGCGIYSELDLRTERVYLTFLTRRRYLPHVSASEMPDSIPGCPDEVSIGAVEESPDEVDAGEWDATFDANALAPENIPGIPDGASEEEPDEFEEDAPENMGGDIITGVQFHAASVEEWLEKWLRGDLHQTESDKVLSWRDVLRS